MADRLLPDQQGDPYDWSSAFASFAMACLVIPVEGFCGDKYALQGWGFRAASFDGLGVG